ncbi:MAG: glycerol-3-phosphate acyltransferase [Dysgonamonadaceae bacterium]
MNSILLYLFCLIVGYLIGSILFADLITRYVKNVNIRELGNGNPGAYNVFRNVSKFWGVVSGLLDAMKALGPMLIASHYFQLPDIALACLAIGAILGHGLPIYYRFKGGRAASVLMGMYIFFIPYEFFIALAITAIVVLGFIRKEYGIWGPTGVIALCMVLCLLHPHPHEVRVFVWIGGLIVLLFNLDKVKEKTKSITPTTAK